MTMASEGRAVEFILGGRSAKNGDINQLITGELRERLKPFVFLDHFNVQGEEPWGFPYHPHSGVATFTYTQTTDLKHLDTGGNSGVLERGRVQWMAAGGGIWHEEFYQPAGAGVKGIQPWMVTVHPPIFFGPRRIDKSI